MKKSLIDDLVIRFKGTNEEKQLRSIQKKFQEMYQNNNVLTQEKGIKYHINSINENTFENNRVKEYTIEEGWWKDSFGKRRPFPLETVP